jgi:hypothetical protein
MQTETMTSAGRRAGVATRCAIAASLVGWLFVALAGSAAAAPGGSIGAAPIAAGPRPSLAQVRQAIAQVEGSSPLGWVHETFAGYEPIAISCVAGTTFCMVVVESSNDAYVTSNGTTWAAHAMPSGFETVTGAGVSCASTSDCWVTDGESPPEVVGTTDGGAVWTNETPAAWKSDQFALDGISCPSTSVCYAAGGVYSQAEPEVAKLSGGTWSLSKVPAGSYFLKAISCATAASCTAVGGHTEGTAAAAIATSNGGSSWKLSAAPILSQVWPFTSVSCATASDCWATLNYPGSSAGSVLASTDGGLEWTLSLGAAGASEDLTGIDCIGQVFATTDCWSVGWSGESGVGFAEATADGGRHWYEQTMVSSIPLDADGVSCASTKDCWAASGGDLWSTTDGGHSVPVGSSATVLASYPSKPMVGQVAFLLALVTEPSSQPSDAVTFTFGGKTISFCSSVGVRAVPRSTRQSYAVCSIIYEISGDFSLGARYSGDYYDAPSGAAAGVPVHSPGYRFVAADGGIFCFGHLPFDGSVPGAGVRTEGVVGMAPDLDTGGYWVASSDGGLFSFDAPFKGSAAGHITAPVTGIAATNDSLGYWLVSRDGNVYAYGDAPYAGRVVDVPSYDPIVGIAANPLGAGYWVVGRYGDVYAFGGATNYGGLDGKGVADIVGIASDTEGDGYWLTASNGAVYAFGKAGFYGSEGGAHLTKPIVGMSPDPATGGYWLVGADGGIFAFHAPFYGSTGNIKLNQPIDGMSVG